MALVASEPKRAVKRVIYENATMMKFEALRELEKKQESSTTSARGNGRGKSALVKQVEWSRYQLDPSRPQNLLHGSLYVTWTIPSVGTAGPIGMGGKKAFMIV
jgi:hypothetical protein